MSKIPSGVPQGKGTATLKIEIDPSALTFSAAAPELISQRNVEQAIGMPARLYLETVRQSGFPLEVVKFGKLRFCDRVAFVSWLRSQAGARPNSAPANDGQVETEDEAVDRIFDELDLERTPTRQRPARRTP